MAPTRLGSIWPARLTTVSRSWWESRRSKVSPPVLEQFGESRLGRQAGRARAPRPGRPDKAGRPAAVNLNTATVQQLDALPGVGPVQGRLPLWPGGMPTESSPALTNWARWTASAPERLEKLRPLVRV